MKYTYDTNVLLSHLDMIDLNEDVYIPSKVLEEIENIKCDKTRTDELRYNARYAARWLREHMGEYEIIRTKKTFDKPDYEIIHCATKVGGTFVTGDVNCANFASMEGLTVVMPDEDHESIYKGYKEITGDTNYINQYMSDINYNDWFTNEYLIINNTDDSSTKEMRFDGEKFVALKLPSSKYIKGKNALQRCALDMLMNPDITICAVLGGYGSGKTALTTKMALYQVQEKGNQSKIDIVREPKGEGDSVGWLKGDFEDKTDQFFLPFVQQLDGGEFEMEALKQRGVLEAHIPYYCKGLTFSSSIVVVDEAEDLDEKQIRLIGTRLGENSRIFLNGDYKQSIIRATKDNSLIKMCNCLKGNPMFATIYLGEDVRSTTSKLFSQIFE